MPSRSRQRVMRCSEGKDLTRLPGVGPSVAADLHILGVRSITDLARRNPERLYASLCHKTGKRQDPCVLYVFRCAVYAARVPGPKPYLLKWWNWKGRRLPAGLPRPSGRVRVTRPDELTGL